MTREEAIKEIKKVFTPAFANYIITALIEGATVSDKEPTTKNDLALINTEGLDEGIRCAMCTNSMANDRGCDGSCVVNNAMCKKVMDVIESHIAEVPSVIPQEPKKGHWIYLKHNKAKCSECDDVVLIAQTYGNANYCPNCGARMIESEET